MRTAFVPAAHEGIQGARREERALDWVWTVARQEHPLYVEAEVCAASSFFEARKKKEKLPDVVHRVVLLLGLDGGVRHVGVVRSAVRGQEALHSADRRAQ